MDCYAKTLRLARSSLRPLRTDGNPQPKWEPTGPFKRFVKHNRTVSDGSSAPRSSENHLQSDKALLLNILESSATRRDAKSYLSKFRQKPKEGNGRPSSDPIILHGVNLGDLFNPVRSHDGPGSARLGTALGTTNAKLDTAKTHVAVVKIRHLDLINDDDLRGVSQTLSQLSRLGLVSIVLFTTSQVLEKRSDGVSGDIDFQVDRLVDAFQQHGATRAQRMDYAVELSTGPQGQPRHEHGKPSWHATQTRPDLLLGPLRRGVIPIIPPLALTGRYANEYRRADPDVIVSGLIKMFASSPPDPDVQGSKSSVTGDSLEAHGSFSLDRIILLDRAGGVPATDRNHGPHIYINLEQEFDSIMSDLRSTSSHDISAGNINLHRANLRLLNDCLSILPPTSSGIIATPQEVARSANRSTESGKSTDVRTRRRRNPLIHNLLTDKPAVSSSLPYSHFSSTMLDNLRSTFVKRGMPVKILPTSFQSTPNIPAGFSSSPLSLSDPGLDCPRLFHLIEQSFGKKLDIPRYCSRIQDKLACVIIAGDYEGCAVLTWETTPQNPGDSIPYLDKFAVLPRSQGAGTSVADLVFKAMVKDCFPSGVCWRSRANNPVNRWYFERAAGTAKVSGTKWTSFWTTEIPSIERLNAYETICRNVDESWVS